MRAEDLSAAMTAMTGEMICRWIGQQSRTRNRKVKEVDGKVVGWYDCQMMMARTRTPRNLRVTGKRGGLTNHNAPN